MNYVELEIGGKKRGAKLGIGFLKSVTDAKNISLDDLFKSVQGANAIFLIIELMYYSLAYNAKRKGEEFTNTLDDVMDWVDEEGGFASGTYNQFSEALGNSFKTDMGKDTPQKKVATKK